MYRHKATISGWGCYPVTSSYLIRPERIQDLKAVEGPVIARGYGKSYGDASLNTDRNVLLMERMNCFLSFDEHTGVLKAEAGTSLDKILTTFIPRGWFIPVTPGTKFVTLGGCFAADVHGKNHHVDGSFSKFVKEIDLLLADGRTVTCSPQENADLFWATAGGMGLTGIITTITIQLMTIETAYMTVRNYPAKNLSEVMAILDNPKRQDKYSVAWIDCQSTGEFLGRGIVMNGHHAVHEELPDSIDNPFKIKPRGMISIPFNFPSCTLNPWSINGFNSLYYNSQVKKKTSYTIDYDRYFYPLDAIANWNRFYGKRGFIQYQFVVPENDAETAIRKILMQLSAQSLSPFLAVLKKFGPENPAPLSFPHSGYTLALDIPIKNNKFFEQIDQLDEIVLNYNGRIYLAKDSRTKPANFRTMYPRFLQWKKVKTQIDPNQIFSSDLSQRLEITK